MTLAVDNERLKLLEPVLASYTRRFAVLDLGCGDGSVAQAVKQSFPNACVLTMDRSSDAAIMKCEMTPWRLEQLANREYFSVVLALNFLHHFDDWPRVLKAIARMGRHVVIQLPAIGEHRATRASLMPEMHAAIESAGGVKLGEAWYPPFNNNRPLWLITNTGDREVLAARPWTVSSDEPTIIKIRSGFSRPWIPGMNLWNMIGLGADREWAAALVKQLTLPEPEHGDICPWNLIYDSQRLHLIDPQYEIGGHRSCSDKDGIANSLKIIKEWPNEDWIEPMNYRKFIETTPELATWYNNKYTEMNDGWHTPAEECNKHLDALGVPFDRSKTLLDVGCGAGHFLAEADKRCTVLGLEISEVGLAHCAQRVPQNAFLELGSIENELQSNALAPFDYIVSIGSLEHVVELDKALDNIRGLLKPQGRFYFYCPNELWVHEDQPNERTMPDAHWTALFKRHGLYVHSAKRWNDSTAFIGGREPLSSSQAGCATIDTTTRRFIQVKEFIQGKDKLNCGSGQRPFDSAAGWVNLDMNERWNPDVIGDWNNLSMFADASMSLVVSHHSLEHVGCGEGSGFIQEAHRVLKPGGSLLVFVPDMKALAQRWLTGQIDEQIYMTNVYGAYMGDEADRHKWGYSGQGLWAYLKKFEFSDVKAFNWRTIDGADLAKDWWVNAMEAVK